MEHESKSGQIRQQLYQVIYKAVVEMEELQTSHMIP